MNMNLSSKFYLANGILSDESQEKETINGDHLTSVAFVNIMAPDCRLVKNTDCYIYGDVSFRVGDTEVILFSRKRDNPDHLFLALSDLNAGSRLSLSDHHESNRPLPAVSSSHPLYVKMNLHEKKGSEEEDVLIADTEHSHPGGEERKDWCYFMDVPGLNGFNFLVSYSVALGAWAKVDVRIKGEEGFPKKRILFSGRIESYQFLEKLCPNHDDGISDTLLRKIYHPVTLNVGESIALTRRFVVVPMGRLAYLGIRIVAVINEEGQDRGEEGASAVNHYLYFPLRQLDEGIFFTNKDLTHSKHFKHSSGIEFHVSIIFCRPILGKRPRSSEHDDDDDDGGVL